MARRPPEPLFLERQTYRRRRLMDAARLLPVVGLVLFLFPMLWAGSDVAGEAATSMGGLYVFGVWTALIIASALLSRRLIRDDPAPRGPSGGPSDGPDAP